MEIPATPRHVFNRFLLTHVARALTRMDSLDVSTTVVKEHMIKNMPDHDFVPIEQESSLGLLPKMNPSSRRKINRPFAVKLSIVRSRGGKKATPRFIRQGPLVHLLVPDMPTPTVTKLQIEMIKCMPKRTNLTN